jgi:hypothetical protein
VDGRGRGPLISLIFHSFHPSEADYLVSEQFSFYGVRVLASRPTPNLEDQGILLRLASRPTPNLEDQGILLRLAPTP